MKTFLITTLAVATLTTAAFADAGEYGRGGRKFQRAEARQAVAERLGLTDAQKQRIREVRKAAFEQNKALFESAREKRFELGQLRDANDPRAESVRSELLAMREQLRAARLATREKVRALLTAEQRAQLDQMREQRRQRRGERRNR
jgi:Spy/CpxP family protein refolding chaperone